MVLSNTLQKVKSLLDKGMTDAADIANAMGCKKSSVYSYLSRLRKVLGQSKPKVDAKPKESKIKLHRDIVWFDIVPTLQKYLEQNPVSGTISERVSRLFEDYCEICKRPTASYCTGCPLKFMIDNYLNLED